MKKDHNFTMHPQNIINSSSNFARPSSPSEDYSIAGASSQVTATDVADSESYLALHEIQQYNNNSSNINSTRDTISLGGDDDFAQHYSSQYSSSGYRSHSSTDATEVVHEMHLALLYLLSNPEEFQRAMECHAARDGAAAKTLEEWNADYQHC